MRSRFLIAAAALLPLLLGVPSAAQTAAQNTPQALKATYDQAMQAKDWPAAIAAAQQLVGSHATAENLKLLGNAQLYGGAAEESLATYDRALAAAEQEKPAPGQPDAAWKDMVATIYIGKGNAFLKLHRNPDAVDAYNRSAEMASNPGLAYFNLCAVLYNIGDTKNSAAACRKCVQADPSRANAWFVLGSDLFADLPTTAQGKVIASPETQEALEKYLELAPDGPHAADAKAMLDMLAK
jgi:tetratricopeptide (TPR) repeat protein